MRGMILAAGRGKRMGSLTQELPKALLPVQGRYLIEYPLRALVRAGIREIVINVCYHGDKIKQALGNGLRYGADITYSEEAEPLETGGGIFQVLSFFKNEPFLVVSSDIITDYPLANLLADIDGLAHLLMVTNPAFRLSGDFGLREGKINLQSQPRRTFASVAAYRPELFTDCKPGKFRLTDVLLPAIAGDQVTGLHYEGLWYNIGTPEDLAEVNQRAREDSNLRPLVSETNTLST